MTLSSMTGFARAQGQLEDRIWTWEARSVNGRGLDIRCRLPYGLESLDAQVRAKIAKRFRRGNISVTLNVHRSGGSSAVRINMEVLDRILSLLPDVQARLPNPSPPSAHGVLGLRGVIETVDEELSEETRAALDAAVLDGMDRIVMDLAAMRDAEGEALTPVLTTHLGRIEELIGAAGNLAASQPEAVMARLREQVTALLSEVPALPEERLAQESALLAARADPREEIDRLQAHTEAARTLLSGSDPVGRRLDFLCQEFNREANTLCSKSADVELTRVGLELKATIEQFREQVQNIE